MSNYTIQLRKICDLYTRTEVEKWFKNYSLSNFLTYEQINQIEKAGAWSKDKLAEKIVDHYYMREIGFETPALFKHFAKVYMNEIMERKLPEIYSKYLEYDPLSNVDYTETYRREISGISKTTGSSESSSFSKNAGLSINNDTPQTNIIKQNLDSGFYATQVGQSESSSSISDTTETGTDGSSNTVETYTHTMKGDNGVIITNQRLVKEYREIIVSIDESIILELNKLFIGIY